MRLLIIACAVGLHGLLMAQGAIPQPSRSIEQTSPGSKMPLSPYARYFYNRDPYGKLLQFQTDHWDGTDYALYSTDFNNYDLSGNLIETVSRRWSSTAGYTDNYRFKYTYDSYGNRLSRVRETYDAVNNIWKQTSEITYTYTPTYKLAQRTTISYSGGVPTQGSRATYQYDELQRDSVQVFETMTGGVWKYTTKSAFDYTDDTNKPAEQQEFVWNEGLADWVIGHRYTNTYDSLHTLRILKFPVSGGNGWDTLGRYLMAYNDQNQLLSNVYEVYNTVTDTFSVSSSVWYEYNTDYSIKSSKSFKIDPITQAYFQNYQEDYDYEQYSATNTPALDIATVVSPNPTTGFFQVKIDPDALQSSPIRLRLFQSNGHLLQQTQLTQTTVGLDLADQPNGVYFLTLEQNGKSKVIPLVKM